MKVALIPKLDVLLVSDSLDNYTYTFWKLFYCFIIALTLDLNKKEDGKGQARKIVLEHISKSLKISQKYSTTRQVFKQVVKHDLSCLCLTLGILAFLLQNLSVHH